MNTYYVGNKKIKKVNVNGCDDPFYRYKVIQLLAIPIGTKKLDLKNISDVASDLHISPELVLKWISYDCNVRVRDKMIYEYVTLEKLSESLRRFIVTIILCPKCELPELSYHIDKNKIRLQCDSCGYYGRMISTYRNKKFEKYMFRHLQDKNDDSCENADVFPISGGLGCHWSVELSDEACETRQKELCGMK